MISRLGWRILVVVVREGIVKTSLVQVLWALLKHTYNATSWKFFSEVEDTFWQRGWMAINLKNYNSKINVLWIIYKKVLKLKSYSEKYKHILDKILNLISHVSKQDFNLQSKNCKNIASWSILSPLQFTTILLDFQWKNLCCILILKEFTSLDQDFAIIMNV